MIRNPDSNEFKQRLLALASEERALHISQTAGRLTWFTHSSPDVEKQPGQCCVVTCHLVSGPLSTAFAIVKQPTLIRVSTKYVPLPLMIAHAMLTLLGSHRAMTTIVAFFMLLTATSAYQEVVNFGSIADLPRDSLELETDHFVDPGIQDIKSINDDNAKFTHMNQKRYGSGEPYWVGQIKRQGKSLYNGNSSYLLWRNVKDYGAKGDGVTDDS